MNSNPFIFAFQSADSFGKGIFILLFCASIVCWSVIGVKIFSLNNAKKQGRLLIGRISTGGFSPLQVEYHSKIEHPFFHVFREIRQNAIDLLKKNMRYTKKEQATLSGTDIGILESHLATVLAKEGQQLEKYLFLLVIVVALAPLLGLLGTVWGILYTLSTVQLGSQSEMMNGIAFALTTTVLGLITAIPALVGFHFIKSQNRHFEVNLEAFGYEILTKIEREYRYVESGTA